MFRLPALIKSYAWTAQALNPNLDGDKSYLMTCLVLQRMGMHLHLHFQILICIQCKAGIPRDQAFNHALKTHHIKLTPKDLALFNELSTNSQIPNTLDITPPRPGGPPVECLDINSGMSCNVCGHCVVSRYSARNHFNRSHPNSDLPWEHRFKIVEVQSFFVVPKRYFQVCPVLAKLPAGDMFTLYVRDVVPTFKPFPAAGPIRVYEVSPLLQVTQWHEHLEMYMVDKTMRENLLTLVKINPKTTHPSIKNLPSIVRKYMDDVRALSNTSSVAIKCMLQEYPR
jgi:Orsellinic acid/F9775 biosynthesis cluster protein D